MSDFLDFRMNEEGDTSKPLVSIKIPRTCCGIDTFIMYNYILGISDVVVHGCKSHMANHIDIWKNFFVHIAQTPEQPLKCIRCNNINEYATKDNCQEDGSYICRSCISYLYWDCKVPEKEKTVTNEVSPIINYRLTI